MAYGRRRAAARVRAGRFSVHPGWRGRVPTRFEVVTDQSVALEQVRELVDAEDWGERRRREAELVLSVMVWAMDWRSGLITGVTREQLAARIGRSTRSISRVWAWAQDIGLLARVEQGATAEFLGTDRNRAAAFVIVAPVGAASARVERLQQERFAQLTRPVDNFGNLPVSHVDLQTLGRRKRIDDNNAGRWPAHGIPDEPGQRRAAAAALLARTGLAPGRMDPRRLHGLLRPWWAAGVCVAGLLFMLDHHPDHPDQARGCALRSARDPLAVLGHRLAPWLGRTHELPAAVQGRHGDYRAAQKARLAALLPPESTTPADQRPPASVAARAAARAALAEHLAHLRSARSAMPRSGAVAARTATHCGHGNPLP